MNKDSITKTHSRTLHAISMHCRFKRSPFNFMYKTRMISSILSKALN